MMQVGLRSLLACLLATMLLAACGPSEPDQRKAFIGFLQTEILARPGVRLPRPDAEKQKSFGDYAGHYTVIQRFHERMNATVAKPMQEATAKVAPRSIEDVVARKSEIAAVRAGFSQMRQALDAALATAESERAALKQPEDLAKVYAGAYQKLVTEPVATFREVFPVTDETFAAMLALADLIEANKAAIRVSGSQVDVRNAALRNRVQAAITAMNAKQSAMTAAQQKLRQMVYGN